MLKLFLADGSHLGWQAESSDTTFKRGPPKDHPCQVWSKLAQWFQRRRFLKNFSAEFSISSRGGHLGWRAGSSDTTFKRGPPKDHPCQVWSKLAQWFQRRRLKCEKLTTTDDGRRTIFYDGRRTLHGGHSSHDPLGQVG